MDIRVITFFLKDMKITKYTSQNNRLGNFKPVTRARQSLRILLPGYFSYVKLTVFTGIPLIKQISETISL